MTARIHWARIVLVVFGAAATFGVAQAQVRIPTVTEYATRPVPMTGSAPIRPAGVLPDVGPTTVLSPQPQLGLGRPLGSLVVLQDEKAA